MARVIARSKASDPTDLREEKVNCLGAGSVRLARLDGVADESVSSDRANPCHASVDACGAWRPEGGDAADIGTGVRRRGSAERAGPRLAGVALGVSAVVVAVRVATDRDALPRVAALRAASIEAVVGA